MLKRIVQLVAKVEPSELRATALSFMFVFVLMAAYFILRPVRDALSSDWTDAQLSWLWTFTFFFSVIAVSIYGGIISRIRFRIIVPSVYVFFALTFVGFYLAGTFLGDNDLVNRMFYVWLSVFSLFHLSVFWTFMSGLYNKEQAKRLFAVIALGATAGGPRQMELRGTRRASRQQEVVQRLEPLGQPIGDLRGLRQNLAKSNARNRSRDGLERPANLRRRVRFGIP